MSSKLLVQLTFVGPVSVLIALYTHAPCREVFFYDDSLIALFFADIMERQNVPWSSVLLFPWAGNYHPLWLFQARYQYEILGTDAAAWQTANALFQAASAILLFIWSRAWSGTWMGPALASLLWAGTVGGFPDDPAVVIFEAHYPLALTWLLAAMILGVKGIETGHRIWILLGCLCSTLAVAAWEVALFGIPMAALQHFVMPRQRRQGRGVDWISVLLWMFTFFLNGAIIAYVLAQGPPSPSMVLGRTFLEWLGAVLWHLVEATSALLVFDPQSHPSEMGKLRAAIIPMMMALLLSFKQWRTLFLLSAMPLGTIAAVCALRKSDLFYFGDYLYYSLMLYCLLIGLTFNAIRERWPSSRGILAVASIAFLLVFISFQRHKAESLVIHQSTFAQLVKDRWESNKSLIETLIARSQAAAPLRLPIIPLVLQPTFLPVAFPSDAFARIAEIPTQGRIDFFPLSEFTDEDVGRLRTDLQHEDSIAARNWRELLETVVPELKSIPWVAKELKSRGKSAQIPEFTVIRYENLRLAFQAEHIAGFIGTWPENLSISGDIDELSPELIDLFDCLAREGDSEARNWKMLWKRMRPRTGS